MVIVNFTIIVIVTIVSVTIIIISTVYEDDQSMAQISYKACQNLIAQNIHVIIGPPISGNNKVCLQVVKGKEVLYISNTLNNYEDSVDNLIFNTAISNKTAFLDHENIVALLDVNKPEAKTGFDDIYIVTDLMQTDLQRVIYSRQVT